MIKFLLSVGLLFTHFGILAQVGIGTITPSSQLEISNDISNPNLPLLELNPQSAPVGSATGQLAVIGDILYMYDGTRGKWLSLETVSLQYAKNGGADNDGLRFGGDVRDNSSGAKMPFDGTIVYATIETSGGVADKLFDIKNT